MYVPRSLLEVAGSQGQGHEAQADSDDRSDGSGLHLLRG
jgi:hypothetical protein